MTNNLPFFVYASRESGLDSAKNLNLERMEYLQIQNPRRELDGARGGAFRRTNKVSKMQYLTALIPMAIPQGIGFIESEADTPLVFPEVRNQQASPIRKPRPSSSNKNPKT